MVASKSAWWHLSSEVVRLMDRVAMRARDNAHRVAERTGRYDAGGPTGCTPVFEAALLARWGLVQRARADKAEAEARSLRERLEAAIRIGDKMWPWTLAGRADVAKIRDEWSAFAADIERRTALKGDA